MQKGKDGTTYTRDWFDIQRVEVLLLLIVLPSKYGVDELVIQRWKWKSRVDVSHEILDTSRAHDGKELAMRVKDGNKAFSKTRANGLV